MTAPRARRGRHASSGEPNPLWPVAASLRAAPSRVARPAGGIRTTPLHAATSAIVARAKRTSRGPRSARGPAEPGAASIVSSHTRATRSAKAGNAGRPWWGSLKGDAVKNPTMTTAHRANRSQSREGASSQGRRNARNRAHGSASAHGRNASSVTRRNALEPSGTSSSRKTRGRAKRSTGLATSVYQRKPRFLASTSTYQGSAIAARRRTLHHGTHGVRSEEHTSELQSQSNLVCRLLLEKKKKRKSKNTN